MATPPPPGRLLHAVLTVQMPDLVLACGRVPKRAVLGHHADGKEGQWWAQPGQHWQLAPPGP